MSYQVLARKWRPQNFAELVGQEKVLNALFHGLAQNRLHHAYLFTGTRGVGKTTVARILAKALNCEQGISDQPCGVCESCIEIRDGRYIDLIEIDAASRTRVEDTRELLDNIQYAPAKGRFKVYLIDEVHMLSTHSFNALLKTLEEPPEHVKFLLATTDPQKLPVTVLSRCLQFHLKNISVEAITERLQFILEQEKIGFEKEALGLIARAAEGSLRDALSLTDQAIGQGDGKVTSTATLNMLGVVNSSLLYELAECIEIQDSARLFSLLEKIAENAVDYGALLKLFSELWYEVSLKQIIPDFVSPSWQDQPLKQLAEKSSPGLVQLFYEMAVQGRKTLAFAPEPKIGFNMTLLRMLNFQPLEISANLPTPAKPAPASKAAASVTASVVSPASPVAPPQAEQLKDPVRQTNAAQEKIAIEHWEKLVDHLPLAGMLKQMVKNCSFEKLEKEMLTLKMEKAHHTLFNEHSKNKLIEVLQTYYERPFSLQINSSETPVESPAAKALETQKAQDAQLQEKLALDPNIDFIKNNFNAKISSVQIN